MINHWTNKFLNGGEVTEYLITVKTDNADIQLVTSEEYEKLKHKFEVVSAELANARKIIAKELNENDELGAEYVHVCILKDKLNKALNVLKRIGYQEVEGYLGLYEFMCKNAYDEISEGTK